MKFSKENNGEKSKSEWNAGVGAAVGVVLGSMAADLLFPGSSLAGIIGLALGAIVFAVIGARTNG